MKRDQTGSAFTEWHCTLVVSPPGSGDATFYTFYGSPYRDLSRTTEEHKNVQKKTTNYEYPTLTFFDKVRIPYSPRELHITPKYKNDKAKAKQQ